MAESQFLDNFKYCKEVRFLIKKEYMQCIVLLIANRDALPCDRLLKEFVENHQDGLEVVYSLSGWLKENPLNYHIRLVPGPKLAG